MNVENPYRSFSLFKAGVAMAWIIILVLIISGLSISIGYLFGQQLVPTVSSSEELPARKTPKDLLTSPTVPVEQEQNFY